MSDLPATGRWAVYSLSKNVLAHGYHNYLALVDPSGKIQLEIHGTYSQTFDGPNPGNYLRVERIVPNVYPNRPKKGVGPIEFSKEVITGSEAELQQRLSDAYQETATALDQKRILYNWGEMNSNSVW